MEVFDYPTGHNIRCGYRFACRTLHCPEDMSTSRPPSCFIEKFKRYQPDYEKVWYQKNWEEINRITWRDVFSLQETWIYILITITVVVFIFLVMILIKVLLNIG